MIDPSERLTCYKALSLCLRGPEDPSEDFRKKTNFDTAVEALDAVTERPREQVKVVKFWERNTSLRDQLMAAAGRSPLSSTNSNTISDHHQGGPKSPSDTTSSRSRGRATPSPAGGGLGDDALVPTPQGRV